ncbi:MAG: hypothetical protein ABEJ98_05505 [Candidatus Nanohaloarchaea archaeon]
MEKPRKKFLGAAAAVLLVVAWLAVPILAQKLYGFPAVNVAFAVTVVYFLGLKLYQRYG